MEGGNNLVGRWDPETGAFPEVDLEADDPEAKISRKHALIRLDGAKITIEDIGSLNGTYVNRQPRLAPGTPHDLKDGDEIIVGKTFFKVIVEPVSKPPRGGPSIRADLKWVVLSPVDFRSVCLTPQACR